MQIRVANLLTLFLAVSVTIAADRACGHGFALTLATTGNNSPASIKSFAEYPGNYMDSLAYSSAPGNLFYAPFGANPASNSLGTYYTCIHGAPYTSQTWPTFTATYNIISPLYFSDGVGTLASGNGPARACPASAGTFMTFFDRDFNPITNTPILPGASAGTATISGTTSYVPGYGISLDDAHELQKNLYLSNTSTQTFGEYGFAFEATIQFAGGTTLTTGPLVDVFALSGQNLGDFSDDAPVYQQDEATLAIFNAAIKTPDTWNVTTSGSFNDYTKWTTSAVPSGPGQTAVLNASLSSSVTVTLDATQIVGLLTLGNSNAGNSAGFNLASGNGGSLVINNLDTAGIITVISGSQIISAPVLLENNLIVTSTVGSILDISGNISQQNLGMSLTMDGSGTLVLSGTNTFSGGVTASAGTLELLGASSLLAGSSLVIGSGTSDGALFQTPPTSTTTLAPVPEPCTVLLLIVGISLVSFRQYWRRTGCPCC